jgi:cysteinyl-tRNA synthetase
MANGSGLSNIEDILKTAKESFEKGMDNDLNTPEALAAVFDLISEINKRFENLSKQDGQQVKELMMSFDSVLGVLPEKNERQLTQEEQDLIDKRQAARVAKDWATADSLKAQLNALGIEIKDTPTGPQVRFI